MCYNPLMSFCLMVIGTLSTYYFYSKHSYKRYIFGFYTIMELTQFVQSFYVNDCDSTINYLSTVFALFLVAVQPLLWNFYRWKTNIFCTIVFHFAMIASFVWAISYIGRVIPTNDQNMLEANVGHQFCTYQNDEHLYWKFPLFGRNGFEANFFTYLLLWFLPTLWEDNYGVFKLMAWLSQIILVKYFTIQRDVYASVWCLYSIPVLVIMFFSALM